MGSEAQGRDWSEEWARTLRRIDALRSGEPISLDDQTWPERLDALPDRVAMRRARLDPDTGVPVTQSEQEPANGQQTGVDSVNVDTTPPLNPRIAIAAVHARRARGRAQ